MTDFITPGYLALLTLAAVLRWRFQIWFVLLCVVLLSLSARWLTVTQVHPAAPGAAQTLLAKLHAEPWPAQIGDLPPLIGSFRELAAYDDANALGQLYQLGMARDAAGEAPLRFASVAEALAWKPSAPSSRSGSNIPLETFRTGNRALAQRVEVTAPRLSGWPAELTRSAPLPPAAREMAPGVWVAASADEPSKGVLNFPVSAHYRGEDPVQRLDLSVRVARRAGPDEAGRKRPEFRCKATLREMAPGDTRLFVCQLGAPANNARLLQEVLDAVESFRAGGADVSVEAAGALPAARLAVPPAEPLFADELRKLDALKASDEQARRRATTLGPGLLGWLRCAALFALGVLMPGLRGRCLSLPVTLATMAAAVVLALLIAWRLATGQPEARGWQLIATAFLTITFAAPFLGGLLFGNLVRWRAPA